MIRNDQLEPKRVHLVRGVKHLGGDIVEFCIALLHYRLLHGKMSGNDIILHILTDWAAFYKGAAGVSAHPISLLLINSLNDVIKPI